MNNNGWLIEAKETLTPQQIINEISEIYDKNLSEQPKATKQLESSFAKTLKALIAEGKNVDDYNGAKKQLFELKETLGLKIKPPAELEYENKKSLPKQDDSKIFQTKVLDTSKAPQLAKPNLPEEVKEDVVGAKVKDFESKLNNINKYLTVDPKDSVPARIELLNRLKEEVQATNKQYVGYVPMAVRKHVVTLKMLEEKINKWLARYQSLIHVIKK